MHLAFHLDDVFHVRDGAVFAEQSFALFVSALADEIGRVTLVGRQAPDPSRARHRLGPNVALAPLPYYEDARSLRTAGPAMAAAVASFGRVLRDVDGAWLCLGPSPLSFPFAAQAARHRRWLVLGVRQDTPRYVRSRHPGSRGLALAADVLDAGHRALARRAAVVAVGPELAGRFRGASALLDVSISLIGEQALAAPAPRRRYDADRLQLLSVGRLSPEKNPLMLVDVLARLRREDPRWRLVVCGDGPLRAALEERLAASGLAEHAALRGYVPVGAGLEALYRDSHALVNASWTEGVPQVLHEAFAAGLPVVATAVGGVPAAAGGAALLVAPGDAAGAAAQLQRLAADPVLRAELAERARRQVGGRTLEAESRRVGDFLRAVAAS